MFTSRRALISSTGIFSLLGLVRSSGSARAFTQRSSIYQEIGVRPLLNFQGTATALGASKQWPELHEPMLDAARHYVLLNELQDKIGERLASLIGTESAMVTTGAAGAITLGTAACLTGLDRKKILQLPDTSGMKTEVVIQKVHRNPYYHAIRNTGVRIVEVENKEQLLNAIGERTAMMYFLGGKSGDWAVKTPVPLEECLRISQSAGFPVMVDAANMLPPWDNIRKLADLRTQLICISGGKHMRGPQCSGILAGRGDLIQSARLNSSPNPDSLGRPMKVGREEMIGLWLAARKYAQLDFREIELDSFNQAQYLARELKRIRGLKVGFTPNDTSRHIHRVAIEWNEQEMGLTAPECDRKLLDGDPRIAVLRFDLHNPARLRSVLTDPPDADLKHPQGILFTVFMNDPGDERQVVRRVEQIFSSLRQQPSKSKTQNM